MKIIRFSAGAGPRYGILDGHTVKVLSGTPFRGISYSGQVLGQHDVRQLAPCLPSKIVAVGTNYRQHAEELHMRIPAEPLLFLKPSTSVIGPDDKIVYPDMTRQVDYEGELGVVIKTRARRVSQEDAGQYILGYTCCNDVTARDLQNKDGQWTRCKGFDTFAPIGPCIETALDPADTPIETYLNGELKQSGNTSDLIFSVPELLSFISHVMTLLPGDVIATGTPFGVGPMQKGDAVEIKIAPVGTLKNYVV